MVGIVTKSSGESRSVDPRLQDILDLVNEWLRFAEAKNGATVGVAFAVAFGVAQILPQGFFAHGGVGQLYVCALLAQLFFAVCVGVASFLPVTDIGRLLPKGDKKGTDNLLFFGDLMKYSPDHLLAELQGVSIDKVRNDGGRLSKDYAEQIVINSRIASWKFTCSKWAIRLFLSALVTPVFAIAGIVTARRS